MKLDANELLATTAIALGVGQMLQSLKEVHSTENMSAHNFQSLFIGIVASSLWLVYQYRKGANYSAVYTSIGLVVQLYILQRLLSKSKERAKKETHSRT